MTSANPAEHGRPRAGHQESSADGNRRHATIRALRLFVREGPNRLRPAGDAMRLITKVGAD
jgi:hypothetical protein